MAAQGSYFDLLDVDAINEDLALLDMLIIVVKGLFNYFYFYTVSQTSLTSDNYLCIVVYT